MKKAFQLILNPVIGIIIGSIILMKFMPFGTFNYKEIGFYLCIFGAIIMELSLRYVLKKYQKDYMGKVK
jgi:uncharacterized membrane protein YgaE (UPF0421/DUF939 family)